MRLAFKFTLALLLGMTPILALRAFLTCDNEIALIEADMRRDHRVLGHALREAITSLARTATETEALKLVTETGRRATPVSVRWIWLDAPPGHVNYAALSDADRAAIVRGDDTVFLDREAGESGVLRTYVPAVVDPDRPGALELDESLADERAKVRTVIERALVMTAAIVAVYGVLSLACGYWLVGKPIRALMAQARRVGRGDFRSRLLFHGRDELRGLAGELNSMAERLAEADERLRAETEAKIATMAQLRHADRLATVGKLASGVAHELGTPLNVVMARAKMIVSRSEADAGCHENASIIGEQASRMVAIIRQLLDFARPRQLKRASVDLRSLVSETVELLSPISQKAQVSLEVAAGDAPLTAWVDPAQMQQVLSNLAVNGIQACPPGSRVTFELARERAVPPAWHGGSEGEYLRVTVWDLGHGVSPEDLEHVFEPFFTTKDVGEGTGLGLPVALGIVREHGGWIAVESAVGEGSSFSVYLPVESGPCADAC